MDRFVIIDGHGLIWRSIFRPGKKLTSPDGELTTGTYTFTKSLFSIADKLAPSYFVMASDGPRSLTFRRKMFPEYKANRSKDTLDEEITNQVRRCEAITKRLGIPVIQNDDFEADDVIASLVHAARYEDVESVVISRDKDLHQLVTNTVKMFDPADDEWITKETVKKKWGVCPDQVVEIMSLMGDSTDNVPGIKGIGKKRALKLVHTYQQAEVARRCAGRRGEPLCSKEHLDLMRDLVTLRRDVPLDGLSWDKMEFHGFDMQGAQPLFDELGFRF